VDMGETHAASELSVGDLDSFYRSARKKFDDSEAFQARARARVVLLQGGDAETLSGGGGEPHRLHDVAVGAERGDAVVVRIGAGAEGRQVLAQVHHAVDAQRIVAGGRREKTRLADDEVSQLGERVGRGILVAREDGQTVPAEVARPARVPREVLIVRGDRAVLVKVEIGPITLAGRVVGLDVGPAVKRVRGRAVGQVPVNVHQDVVLVVGENLGGLVPVEFVGGTQLEEGALGQTLLDRGRDVAAAAEIVTRPAGGVGVERKAGIDERLRVARRGAAVGDIEEYRVPHVLELREARHRVLRQNVE
ncbi:MAG: arginine--tRNA ligase, partial [Planctomycetia bacterium]|nr:arginine--tRNA ligase [Planctomycetia bacterium]